MNYNKKTVIDILKVSISNEIKLFSGVLVGLLLPKVIGVTDYGYYKTFTLYTTYVGLFMLGIGDGIYLRYGGRNYNELDKKKFITFSQLYIIIEITIGLILLGCSLFWVKNELKFICFALAIYLVTTNLTGYYQIISQITSRFSELSTRNIIQSALIALSIIVLWIINRYAGINVSYRIYVLMYLVVISILAVWYVFTYRDISFGNGIGYSGALKEFIRFSRIGFPLTFANLCSSLILTLDRQFVNLLFDTDTYAVYAFAYNMLSLVTTATTAISTVLYPRLKQIDKKKLTESYTPLATIILALVFGCLSIYFPLLPFINWFLPKYEGSLIIFRIIFPGLAVSSAVTIIMHNFYKALDVSYKFFVKSVVVLIISGIANYIAYKIFHTTISISIASILTLVFWYSYVEIYLIKKYRVQWIGNYTYMIIMMISFYLISNIDNWIIGMVVYLVTYILMTMFFYFNEIKNIRKR